MKLQQLITKTCLVLIIILIQYTLQVYWIHIVVVCSSIVTSEKKTELCVIWVRSHNLDQTEFIGVCFPKIWIVARIIWKKLLLLIC